MSLEIRPVKVEKVIKLLTDPKPEFVSLVDHGANQTPFRVVKMDEGDRSVALPGDTSMPNTDIAAGDVRVRTRTRRAEAAQTPVEGIAVAHAIRFSKEKFTDETAVRAYLADHGYSADLAIAAKGDEFVYEDAATPETSYSDVRDVDLHNGVVMRVGVPTQATEEEVTTKSASESVPVFGELCKKFDRWLAQYSEGTTLAEVMKAGEDGLPPGIWEVDAAFYTALRNNLLGGDEKAVRTLLTDFGDTILRLAAVFSQDTVTKAEADVRVQFLDALTTAPQAEEDALKGVDLSLLTKKTDAAAPAPEPVPSTDTTQAAKDTSLTLDQITSAVKTALAPLEDRLEKVEKTTQTGQEGISSQVTELTKKVASVTDRVSSLETEEQTRKGATEVADGGAAPKRTEKKEVADGGDVLLFRNALGFQTKTAAPAS